MHCPICHKEFQESDPGVAMPFCSHRCKQIDAKRWFNEEYTVFTLNEDALEREIAEGPKPETDEEEKSDPDEDGEERS